MVEKKENLYFPIFIFGLCSLLVARDVIGISFNKFIFVGFILLFAIVSSYKDLSSMLCFMFPLTWGLPYTYIFLGCIIIYWFKRKKIPAPAFILIIIFFLLEIVASFFYQTTDYISIIKYVSVIAIFFTFLYDSEIDKNSCIKAYYYGSIVLCLIILVTTFRNAPSNWLYLFSKGWFRFGNKQAEDAEGMMLSVNSNTLAYYSIVGIAIAYYFIPGTKGKQRWLHIFALGLFLISGVFTVSISWMIVFAVCTLLFVFSQTRNVKAVLFSALGMIVLLLVFRIAISNRPELLSAFTDRLANADLRTGNNRTELMLGYHRVFINNPRFIFLGTGVTQYRQVTNLINSFHNMIQQIFVSYGVFGGLIFFIGLLAPLRKIKKHATTLLDWIPLIVVLLFTQTIQFINPESLMLPFVIAFYLLSANSAKEEENETLYYNS